MTETPEQIASDHWKFLSEFAEILGKRLTKREEFFFKHGITHGFKHGRDENKRKKE